MNVQIPSEGRAVYLAPAGDIDLGHRWDPLHPTGILPGAFNPVHAGHWGLADAAAQILGLPIAFELSIVNVDKPPLAPEVIRRRHAPFTGRAGLWLTNAPRFVDKGQLFPGAVFVVGVDTALRVVDPRYYDGDLDRTLDALARLCDHGSRFLVACRVNSAGECITLADVPVPPAFRDLFAEIPAGLFRLDSSSTEIRSRGTRHDDLG
jgi:hypothetical protein